MTFRARPYDPDREVKQTPAQKAATRRNFQVFRLRSLYALAYVVRDAGRRAGIHALIDAELVSLGALPQPEHERAQRQKRLKRYPEPIEDLDLPF